MIIGKKSNRKTSIKYNNDERERESDLSERQGKEKMNREGEQKTTNLEVER